VSSLPKDQAELLEDIKKLLVLQLLNSGVNGATVADILEMDRGDFSRAFPVKKLLKQKR
jgi:hypothetical protein